METPTVSPVVPATPAVTETPKSAPEVPVKAPDSNPAGLTEPKVPETGQKEPEVKSAENKEKPYKLKVNGKEQNVTLEELLAHAQKGVGANEKFQEAARMRTQTQQLLKLIKENPRAILEDPRVGVDLKKLAEEVLWEQIEREKMTPEQRELQEAKKKISDFEKKQKESETKTQQAEFKKQVEHFNNEFSKDILETLKASSLPKTEPIVKRIAFFLQQALKRGADNIKAKDVIGIVEQEVIRDSQHNLKGLNIEKLVNLLGEERLKEIREYELKKLQGGGKTPTQLEVIDSSGSPRSSGQTSPSKKLTPQEWRKAQDEKFGT